MDTSNDPKPNGPDDPGEPPFLFKPGIEWTDCTTFSSTATGPEALYPYPPQPPGWYDPPVPGVNQHVLHAALCERVQWGPFERGPVYTLFELLSGPLGPDSCLEGKADRYNHLGTLWISDAEIAAYANQTLGVPVYVGEFEIEETGVGSAGQQEWSWGLPGKERSEIAMVEAEGHAQPSRFTERIFWFNDTALSYLDLGQNYEVPTLRTQTGYGRMEEPMVAASNGVHEYATAAGTDINADWSGTVHTFRDYACEEPV